MTTHSEPSVNVILLLSSSHSRIWSLIVGGMMGVWKRTRKSKNNENNGLRPNVSFFVWKRIYTFCTGLAYCPQVSDENCHRKRILSKTLSGETIFENMVLLEAILVLAIKMACQRLCREEREISVLGVTVMLLCWLPRQLQQELADL